MIAPGHRYPDKLRGHPLADHWRPAEPEPTAPDPLRAVLRKCIDALRAAQPLLALPRDREVLEDVARRAEQELRKARDA